MASRGVSDRSRKVEQVGLNTRLFGLLLSPVAEPHLAESFTWFQESAWTFGYDVLTCSLSDEKQQAKRCIQMLLERKVEGIASLILHPGPELIDALVRVNVPVVWLGSIGPIPNGVSLPVDYRRGIREAVQHLALLGHREIALLGCAPRPQARQPKLEAFLAALKEIGCQPQSSWMIESEESFAGGVAGVGHLLALNARPTAVMCSSDAVALGALWALGQAEISVPAGISLICLDGCPFASLMAPQITTVEIALQESTRTAVDMLTSLIGNASARPEKNLLKAHTTLRVRGSTSYPPGRGLPRVDRGSAAGLENGTGV